jgi:hypothetical protein
VDSDDERKSKCPTRTVSLYSLRASSRAFLLSFSISLIIQNHISHYKLISPGYPDTTDRPPYPPIRRLSQIPLLHPRKVLFSNEVGPGVIERLRTAVCFRFRWCCPRPGRQPEGRPGYVGELGFIVGKTAEKVAIDCEKALSLFIILGLLIELAEVGTYIL